MRHSTPDDAELFVCDFAEAFWQIPLQKGQVLIYERTAQGSRCGPLSWPAAGAEVLRLTQSLFFYTQDTPDPFWKAKWQQYVDGPIA
eukprot:399897-Amphidinium_carterae.1